MVNRARWLSLTPEPERELPEAVATMRHGPRPSPALLARERAHIERLILRGSHRQWLRYLDSVVELIDRTAPHSDRDVARARTRAAAVIANHHHLLLGVARRAAERTAAVRERLSAELATGRTRHEGES